VIPHLLCARLSRLAIFAAALLAFAAPAGLFEGDTDIGDNPKPGSMTFNAAQGDYRITGGGANIWGRTDAFHFFWRRLSGDATLTARIRFLGAGAVPHRKAVLMFRQDLTPSSAYADAAVHGSGLASLQYRPAEGADTAELQAHTESPARLRIERRGDRFTLYTGDVTGPWILGGTTMVELHDPVYVGLGVCSHDANVVETAVFSDVTLDTPAPAAEQKHWRSHISIYDLKSRSTRILYTADTVFEAPNWSHDGRYLIVNSGGALYRLPLKGGPPQKIPLAGGLEVNNDHGPSPDGRLMAVSARTAGSNGSRVFLASSDGSSPRLMTPASPSYFHGWSPDGRWLAFVADRGDSFHVFRVPEGGGAEQRLTTAAGYDDGPDYSPDGKWIYFNSNRSGGWDIWRMPATGAGPNDSLAQRITQDELEDWFPHPSPNGRWLVFLSFPKGTPTHNGRTSVELRMMPLPKKKPDLRRLQNLTSIFGGQGTINVNSWSPDSKKFAFVSYERLDQHGGK
jgi:TolB protein